MEENNNENKKITKKQIITMSIGVSILIVLAITATYAFFRFGNNNAFGTTKITAHTPGSNTPSVVLENVNSEIEIELATEDMIQPNGDTTYWASPDGKTTTETVNQLGRAKALLEGTYTCNYTMVIEDKAEDSIYEAFQGMSNKSNNQIILKVNEEIYDFNESNLFPITYNGVLNGITKNDYQYITTSMSIKNDRNIDQTGLANKNIDIEYKVTELKCSETSALPRIDLFAIGEEGLTGKVYSNTPTIYMSFSKNNIESYCINERNNINSCTWVNTNGEKDIRVPYEFEGDNLTLYGYIKDEGGYISEVASNTVTKETPIGNGANYIISLADQENTNVITQTHDTGTEGTEQTGHNTDIDYRYIGASDVVNNYVCLGTLKSDGSCIDDDHLYRIIGVMPTQTTKSGSYENRIKLIKSTEYLDDDKILSSWTSSGYGYRWTGQKESGALNYSSYSTPGEKTSNMNNWEESTLNRKVLNQTFYNGLDKKYQNIISDSVWYLGGWNSTLLKPEIIFKYERNEVTCSTSNSCNEAIETNPTHAERKIGLMYPSDYGFATSGGNTTNRVSCLETKLFNWEDENIRDCKINNWLFAYEFEWTIHTHSGNSFGSTKISNDGFVRSDYTYYNTYVVRPTFYLNSNVNITSGTGSINSPYILS